VIVSDEILGKFAPMAKKTPIELYVIAEVRKRRVALGLSDLELANAIGVSPAFIVEVESPAHSSHYDVSHLNGLALVLGCSPKELLPATALNDPI
jgi:transcriptional regulator with XRE-family HTH domain